MKKLTGIQKSFSSLENKKLTDLTAVQGGRLLGAYSTVYSNFLNDQGMRDIDHYGSNGKFLFRGWDASDCEVTW